ncbi:DUF1080 domain-containing protein [Acidobacteria bacterium AH-259-L09]|nr:DUF1080 domain-containing protein [Acidobacteria bacterium AH-259-L09]
MRVIPLMIVCIVSSVTALSSDQDWIDLFNGKDLTGWKVTGNPAAFSVQNGTIYCSGSRGRMIYYQKQPFDDFILKAEVRHSPKANSGIFFRMTDVRDPVQTGIEMQVLDSYGKENVDKHDFGAIYDIQAPSKNAARPAGQWNDVSLTCRGSKIQVDLNGERVIDMDLSHWTEAGWNADGTKNKFKTAYKEMTKAGYIALQDHGHEVWYRNLRIKPLGRE